MFPTSQNGGGRSLYCILFLFYEKEHQKGKRFKFRELWEGIILERSSDVEMFLFPCLTMTLISRRNWQWDSGFLFFKALMESEGKFCGLRLHIVSKCAWFNVKWWVRWRFLHSCHHFCKLPLMMQGYWWINIMGWIRFTSRAASPRSKNTSPDLGS